MIFDHKLSNYFSVTIYFSFNDFRKFRTDWPWEQDRQMAVYHANPDSIQLASQPENSHMKREPNSRLIAGGWCLSHIPRSGCFFSHFCEDQKSKINMQKKYSGFLNTANEPSIIINIIKF